MSFTDLMKALTQDYVKSLPEKIARIRGQIEAKSVTELRDSFHKLKGTGRTYGLPEVSELADCVEKVCVGAELERALLAAGYAVEILGDIHTSRLHQLGHQLGTDPRFHEIQKQLRT